MRSAESIKGKIRHLAKSKQLSSMEILQMFFFERFLERLSLSAYKNHFILKGGFLISALLGVHNRTTMDIDTTIKGYPLNEETVGRIIEEVLAIDVGDGITFEISSIESIREVDEYDNFRVHLMANFDKIKNPLKMDITTGDRITPKEVNYHYSCMFENKSIPLQAYPIETILAEKIESIVKRNIATTRMRDFYDIYSLYHLHNEELDMPILKRAITNTALKRHSLAIFDDFDEILEEMRTDHHLYQLWDRYQKENPYVRDLKFEETLDCLELIVQESMKES